MRKQSRRALLAQLHTLFQDARSIHARRDADRIQILDLRSAAQMDDTGYVFRSIAAPVENWVAPTEALLTSVIGTMLNRTALDTDRPVVLMHAGGSADSLASVAWAYWVLTSAGFSDVSIMRDGMAGWMAADLPVVHRPNVPTPARNRADLGETFRTSLEELMRNTTRRTKLLYADPEAAAEASSHRASNGTIITLTSGQIDGWLDPFAEKPGCELLPVVAQFRKRGADEAPVLSLGVDPMSAALNWFIASEVMQQEDVTLYPFPVALTETEDQYVLSSLFQ
ncbi:MAG: rhodanese-like domain-containing protein [Pseudomonadota bacterium]